MSAATVSSAAAAAGAGGLVGRSLHASFWSTLQLWSNEQYAMIAGAMMAIFGVVCMIFAYRLSSAKSTDASGLSTAKRSPPATPVKSVGANGSIPVTPPSTPPAINITKKSSGSPASPTEIVTAPVVGTATSPKRFQAPPHHTGAIHLVMGPMFSGKTRELKRRIDVKRIASARKEMKCLLIKYRKDTRYDGENVLVTHNHIKDHDCVAADSLAEVEQYVKDSNFVFVDEGQFFKDLSIHCIRWAREGREVVVAALDAYASQDLWPEIAKLIPWCVSLQKLNAVCGECGSEASLTITRQGPSKTSEKKIGGKDIYDASCIFCCDRKDN